MFVRRKVSKYVVFIFLFVLSFLALYPFFWMMSSSFKPTGQIMQAPPRFFPATPTIENYITVFRANIGRSFMNSVFVSLIRTILTVYSSGLLGYIFAKFSFKGKSIVFIAIVSTMMVPWIVTIIPLYNVFNRIGLLDSYLALILTGIVSGYGIYLVRSFMYQIETSLIESARIDGCAEINIFNKIVLPLSLPALSALGIITFLWSWDDFLWPYLVMSTESRFTLTIILARFAFRHYTIDYGPVIAGSVVSIVPVIIVFLILQKNMIEGISLGAVKG